MKMGLVLKREGIVEWFNEEEGNIRILLDCGYPIFSYIKKHPYEVNP